MDEQKLNEFQGLQQQMQFLAMQKQQIALQLAEIDKASSEVKESTGTLYRFVGSVIVPKDKAVLEGELKNERETFELRQEVLGKQEKKFREKLTELQKEFKSARAGDSAVAAE